MLTRNATLVERVRSLYEARQYEQLLAEVDTPGGTDFLAEPELGFQVADALWRVGRVIDCLQLTGALLAQVGAQGNSRLRRNLLNLLGVVQFEAGELAAAESTWLELLCRASQAQDDNFAARANNNLGIVYTLRGQAYEAVASYERALTAYRQLGYRRGLAQSHHNLAIAYRELGACKDADHHFQEAIGYARADSSEDEIARSEQERAVLLLQRGDVELAEATARTALRRFETLSHPPGIGDAHRVLAMIALGAGDPARAIQLLEPALRIAGATPLPLLEAECLEVLAAVLARTGHGQQASQVQSRADALFVELRAEAWGRRLRSVLEEVCVRRPWSIANKFSR